jgi:Domain of unknown function (DUF6378)
MDYQNTLSKAISTVAERGRYGDLIDVHTEISKIASTLIGKDLSLHDVAMIHHVTKLVRMKRDKTNVDHYVDGINYLAFASEFGAASDVEADIKEMAAKFAPMPKAPVPDLIEGN